MNYRFEGTIKSGILPGNVTFRIDPTSKYKVCSDVFGTPVEAYVAFSEDRQHPKVVSIDEGTLVVSYPRKIGKNRKISKAVYQWFCSHSDTGHSMSFTVNANGKLIV